MEPQKPDELHQKQKSEKPEDEVQQQGQDQADEDEQQQQESQHEEGQSKQNDNGDNNNDEAEEQGEEQEQNGEMVEQREAQQEEVNKQEQHQQNKVIEHQQNKEPQIQHKKQVQSQMIHEQAQPQKIPKPIPNIQLPPAVHPQPQIAPPSSHPSSHPSTIPGSHSQSQQQKYINALQHQIQKIHQQLHQNNTKIISLNNSISLMASTNKQLNDQLTQKQKQIKLLKNTQKTNLKQIQGLKAQKQTMKEQLNMYREVGDVRLMKQRVLQLEQFRKILENQLKMERSKNMSQQQSADKQNSVMLPKEYIDRMTQLIRQKQQSDSKVYQLQRNLNFRNKQQAENVQIMNKMDQQLKINIERIGQYEERLKQQELAHEKQRKQLKLKISTLQAMTKTKSLDHNSNNPNPQHQQVSQNPLSSHQTTTNNYLTKISQLQKQKSTIFHQYLKLQLQYKSLQQILKQSQNKSQQLYKQMRNIKNIMVSKKDYQDLMQRYKKCRSGLERAIVENKQLRALKSNSNQGQFVQQDKVNVIQNDEQNNSKKYSHLLAQHMQKMLLQKAQTQSISLNLKLQSLTTQLLESKNKIKSLQNTQQRLQTLNKIFQNQLLYKNQLLDQIRKDASQTRQQYWKLKKQSLNIQQQLSNNIAASNKISRIQGKAANLLERNRKILGERDSYREMYQQIKGKFQGFLARDNSINRDNRGQKVIVEQQKQAVNMEMQEQGEVSDQQNDKYKKVKIIPTTTSQTQTQGLSQLYYKQIKETLSSIKKFPEFIKTATVNYQKIGVQLQQYKKKYDQTAQKYNSKFRVLQNQKNQNDTWRQNTRKQIINEFQDIRELIQGDRLLSCLRKAKGLIQGLEDQGEEEGEIGENVE